MDKDRSPESLSSSKRESGRIARAAGVLGSTTMLSRVLGLARDVITAAFFGAGGGLDAFLVAFRLPNMLRSLFAEGSLTVSFVPTFVELGEKEGKERANELGRVVLTLLALALVCVVVIGVVFAPWIVRVVAMGFTRDPEKFALTVELTRMVFPYIGLVAITAFLGGILNARNVFFYPALAPVVLNVCIIAAAVGLFSLVEPPVTALAYGVIAGGICQVALQIRPAARVGFTYRPSFNLSDPALRKVFLLMGPAVFGVAVYQFNLVISTFLASWLPDGSVSYLYYAERLFQLPLGVFAVSVGMASLPSLSRLVANEQWEDFSKTLSNSMRLLWFVVVPATVGLFILAEPIVTLLFKRGRFDAAMVSGTAVALSCYALALLPVASTRIIVQGFYSMKDTKTPVKGAAIALAVNLAASLALMGPMKHAGLALATAISALVNTLYLCHAYRRATGGNPFAGLMHPIAKMTLCSAAMGGVIVAIYSVSPGIALGRAGAVPLLLFVGAAVVGGASFYAVAARVCGLREASALINRLRPR